MSTQRSTSQRVTATTLGRRVSRPVDRAVGSSVHSPTIVTVVDGDPWEGSAAHVVTMLAGGNRQIVRLPATAHASSVARVADQYQSALIVLAAPEVGAVERVNQVARTCAIAAGTRHPVLMVPPSAHWPPRVCVAGIDFSRASIAAATAAGDLLALPGKEVFAIVDTERTRAPARTTPPTSRHLTLLTEAIPLAIPGRSGVARSVECLRGVPVLALQECATIHQAELLAIGLDRAARSPWRLATTPGPTVRALLANAQCPVLISRAP